MQARYAYSASGERVRVSNGGGACPSISSPGSEDSGFQLCRRFAANVARQQRPWRKAANLGQGADCRFDLQAGTCNGCGNSLAGNPHLGEPRYWDMHHKHYLWSELRDAANELTCLMPDTAHPRYFIRRLKVGMFRDVTNVEGICKSCHRKKHL